MQGLRTQYFLAFALTGSLLPFLPVVFKEEQGLREAEIGLVLAISQISVLLTPVLLTLIADTRRNNRVLVMAIFGFCALFQAGLWLWAGFHATMILFLLHSLAFMPMLPLQDGLYFQARAEAESEGRKLAPYHRIRMMGTIGFILPSLILYWLLQGGFSLKIVFIVATFFCLLGILNALRLPRLSEAAPASPGGGSRLPTAEAGSVLFQRPVALFCAGIGLAHFAGSAYYGFYPLYLTQVAGVEAQWIGLIANIGVVVEIGFMAGFGWLALRLGIRWVVVLGLTAMFLRLAFLALFPGLITALGIQFFHGMIIIATHVAPILVLNSLAKDSFRNSIQGLFTLVFVGAPRILGSLVSGYMAEYSLQATFGVGAVLCGLGVVCVSLAFRDERLRRVSPQ